MKEIKFRVWLKSQNKYFDVYQINFKEKIIFIEPRYSNNMFSFDDCVIEQYTGLKDKNGKDIYEGDIVRFSFSSLTYDPHYEVRYIQDKCLIGLVLFPENDLVGALQLTGGKANMIEVIGNIHEGEQL